MSELALQVLIVDSSREDRETYRDLILRGAGDVYNFFEAETGEEGLRIARTEHPDCILLEYHLPDFDGIEFLQELCGESPEPDIAVVMLTGQGSESVAAQAMKLGAMDYLIKGDLTPGTVRKTIRDAVQEFDLRKEVEKKYDSLEAMRDNLEQTHSRDRSLLTQTFQGSLKMLVDIMASISPRAYNRASHVRDIVKSMIAEMSLEDSWKTDLSASLAYLGCIMVPSEIVHKFHSGSQLSPSEMQQYLKHPQAGHNLLAYIPQLRDVAEIILYQEKGHQGSGVPLGPRKGDDIPLGARILKVASDYHLWILRRCTPAGATARLRGSSVYDPKIVEILEKSLGLSRETKTQIVKKTKEKTTCSIPTEELVPGMILAGDLTTSDGSVMLAPKGDRVTEQLLLQIVNYQDQSPVSENVEIYSASMAAT